MPVGGVDRFGGAGDEQQHDGDFHHDNDVVEVGGFLDADHQQRRDDEDDDDRGQIEDGGDMRQGGGVGPERLDLLRQAGAEGRPASLHFQPRSQRGGQVDQLGAARRGKLRRHDDAEVAQEGDDIARPANRDGDGADGVFEDQVPADDPGKQFAQGGVAVGVGAASHRNQRGELAVAERREDRGQAGQHERKHHRRAGVLRRDRSREHEDARADNGADAQGGEVHRAERPVEALVGQRFGLQVGNTLASKQVHGWSELVTLIVGPALMGYGRLEVKEM